MALGFLVSALAACAPQVQQSTHTTDAQGDGIIGGKDISSSDPLIKGIVAVYNASEGALCTGSLLQNNVVLTAAHCIGEKPSDLFVLFDTVLSGSSLRRPVDQTEVSAEWATNQDNDTNTGDIAVLHFTGTLPAGYAAATLLTDISVLKAGATVTLAGYGISNGVTSEGAGTLRETDVTIADAAFSKTEIKLDQTHGQGACHGDSGGPAYIQVNGQYFLWGITSRGVDDPNNDCSRYSAYTDAVAYADWLKAASARVAAPAAPVPAPHFLAAE